MGHPVLTRLSQLVNNPFPMETAESDQDAPVAPLRRVAVVTDSASAIPPEMAAEFGIAIAPMEITIDGRTYVEGPSVSLKTFYRDLVTANKLPTTSAPKTPGMAERNRGSCQERRLRPVRHSFFQPERRLRRGPGGERPCAEGASRRERQGVRLRERGRFPGPHRTRGSTSRGSRRLARRRGIRRRARQVACPPRGVS